MDAMPKIDRSKWPRDTRTLADLVERLMEAAPTLDDEINALIQQNPQLVEYGIDARGRRVAKSYLLGRLVAIWTLNFLCRTYGRPDLGYVPQSPPDASHH